MNDESEHKAVLIRVRRHAVAARVVAMLVAKPDEEMGDRAICPQCKTYASFNITSSGPDAADDTTPPDRLIVKCRQCGNEWRM